jgi:hypothetical protein
MSLYKVNYEDKNTTNGLGLFYNTQNLKVKAEGSSSTFKTGAMVQVNPLQNPIYFDIGGNYINEKVLGADLQNNNINQYSGAFALGYNLNDDLYLEAGENISQVKQSQTLDETPINTSLSKETYLQLGKRFETPIGIVDTHINSSQLYSTLAVKEDNYAGSVNYYLNDTINVGYFYSINQNEMSNGYSIDLNYFTTQYTKDITQDSYYITLGLKANFTDIMKLSSYKPTKKVKKRLSKSHKFENLILQQNMHLHQ